MKNNTRAFILTICITALVATIIILGILYGLKLLPQGTSFSFDTLGVFLGAIGSVGAIFAIWLTTRKQLKEQKEMQKQNVQISIEQNELQKQIVNISEEQKEVQKQNIKIILFEKRISVYDNTIKLFSELIKAKYDIFELYGHELASGEDLPWMDTGFTKLLQLFGKKSYLLAKNAMNLSGPICEETFKLEKIFKAIVENLDSNGEFANVIHNPYIVFDVTQEDQLKLLCEKYVLNDFKLRDEIRNFNYFDIYKQRRELIQRFNVEYQNLIKSMEAELHLNEI